MFPSHKPWVEQHCVEAAFVVALAISTAALHYAHGFSPAFASLASSEHAAAVAAATNAPFYNYVCLLAAAAAAYAAARTAAAYAPVAALPKSSQGTAARRAALALCLLAVLLVCYVGAGYPRLGDTVMARWVAANWERNGERDLRWCGRLFALLACWQALLAIAVGACRVLAGLILLPWTSGAACRRDSKSPSVSGKQEQEEKARNGSGSSVRERKPREAVGKDDRTQSGPEGRDGGAPGWEKEKTG
ncbi:unnamed protein product [Ectocarpus sp. CCAP 1310/34]|nr:unnamed protein product [Ectocarpus sp. CCAP 1310/34]